MSDLAGIGGPAAVNRWSFLATAILVVGSSLLVPAAYAGGVGERLLVAAGGLAVALPVLAVARATVLRAGPHSARPLVALATFALAGAAQGVAVLVLRDRLGLPADDAVVLVVARALAAVVWLAAVAVLVDDVRGHARRMAELRGRAAAYAQALEEEQFAAGDGQALVHEILAPLLRGLDELGEQVGRHEPTARGVEQVDALRRLIEREVRPLSHDLLAWSLPQEEPGIRFALRRLGGRDVVRLATSMVAGPTWLAVLMPTALALLFSVQRVGLLYLAVTVPCSVLLLAGGFALARRRLEPALGRARTAVAALALLVLYEALAAIAVANAYLWGWLSVEGRVIEWSLLATLPVIWFAMALRTGVREGRRDEEERLGAIVEQQALELARRRQAQRHLRQSLARVLHGTVQASLLAITARVERAGALDDARRAVELDCAAEELRELRQRIATPPVEAWEAREALEAVAALWTDILAVRLDCPPAVLARIDRSPPTRSALVDVVAEALTNAMRHGGARTVDVSIAIVDADRLVVVVRDDGASAVRGAPGLGSRLYDVLALEWEGVYGADGGHLRAVLPFAEAAAVGTADGLPTFG